jgi:uroporphyrinogen decarboxylase
MTPHQRFLACARHRPVDRPPLLEAGVWEATVRRWRAESGRSREEVLAWQAECDAQADTGVDFSMQPPGEERVLAEDTQTVTRTDRMGLAYREFKDNPERSMPQFLGFPVRTRQDWEAVKRRFDPTLAQRYPADWPARLADWRRQAPILRLYGFVANYYGGPSLFGFVRMLLGPERALYAFYDDPALVEDMMETSTEFSLVVLARVLREAPVTYVQFWEDMAYKTGPLISPAMVRKFMLPRYRRLVAAIRAAGVDLIIIDSDGDVSELLPIWLEAGINGVQPLEQAAGNDVHSYRRRYGRDLLLLGGLDKRALARGPEAIDCELAEKLQLAHEGGYVPMVDHGIPPDVSWDNWQYYWERKKKLLGLG